MTKEQQQVRNKLYYELWENYKNRWSMQQLAEIVNCPLPTFYEILRNHRAIDVKFGDGTKIKVV